MSARARKTAAFSVPVLLLVAGLIWLVQSALAPAKSRAAADDPETAAAARAAEQYEIPPALHATGGPYRDAEDIRARALRQAVARKAERQLRERRSRLGDRAAAQ